MLEKTKLMKLKDKVQLLEADHPDILDENDEFPSGTDLTLNNTGDLPMEVDVGGNSTQVQYEGYNLVEEIIENATIGSDGVLTSTSANNAAIAKVEQGKTYTIKQESDTLVYGLYTQKPTINSVSYNNARVVSTTIPMTFTSDISGYIAFRISLSDTTPMLYEGTTDKSYEPYTNNLAVPNPNQESDINNVEGNIVAKAQNKNWFDSDELLVNSVYNDKFITNEKSNFYGILEISKLTFPLTISTDIILNDKNYNDTSLRLDIFDDSMNYITRIYGSNSTTSNSKSVIILTEDKIPANAVYIRLDIRLNSAGYTENSQIEEGTTATPYVPHEENSVTFPLSQGQKLMLGDTLEDDGIHHKRVKIRINSSNYNISISANNSVCFIKNLDNSNFYSTNGLCTYFTNANVAYLPDNAAAEQILNDNQFNFRTGTKDRVYFKNSNFTSLEDWINFFTNNEVYLEYELETETIEAYTTAQQTAYNKLKEMQSYYDLTYVVGSSDNAQPILTVQAKKSLKVINDEISNINSRLTLLEE